MASKTDEAAGSTGLTSRQRLGRGLAYSAMGPVDVTRGTIGLGAQAVAAAVGRLRRACAERSVVNEISAAAAPVSRCARPSARRAVVVGGAAALVLAAGAVAFSVIRRTKRAQEPTTLAPSVHIDPRV